MTSYVSVILNQVILMLILVVAGFISFKTHIITGEGNKHLSNLLILLVNPVVIFVSYQRDFSPELLAGLGQAFLLSLLGFGIAMAVAYLCLRRSGKYDVAVERFSVIYSNCGFMGIPLVMAMLGTEGVFYLTAVMTAFNLIVWTHGLFLFTGTGQFSIKGLLRALCSPAILSVPVGLLCFLLQWRVPQVLYDALEYVSNMNTPLAMLIAGATVAQTNLLKAFARGRIYYVSFLKLLLVPALIVLALSLFPLPQIVLLTVAVAMASPTATMGTIFAIRYDRNAVYASELFAVTTILSAVSLPLVVFLAERLLWRRNAMRLEQEKTITALLTNDPALQPLEGELLRAHALLREAFSGGGKLLVCGNGGSAADSAHVVGELMKGFRKRRPLPAKEAEAVQAVPQMPQGFAARLQQALPAIDLTAQAALLTAFANDVDPDMVFAQQVYGYGRAGDALLALTTSGNSKNVVNAVHAARARGMRTLGITGEGESALSALCDVCLRLPARETARVQEYTLPVYHALCALIEDEFFAE